MNYKHNLCATLLFTLVSASAFADLGNIYAAGKIGASFQDLKNFESTSDRWGPYLLIDSVNSSETKLAYGGAVGYRWNTFLIPIRMEADYTFRNPISYDAEYHDTLDTLTGTANSTIQSQTILGNVYIDLPLGNMFALFIGGGGGLGFNSIHTTNTFTDTILDVSAQSEETTYRNNAVWMATAGVSVIPAPWLAVDLSYRYSDLGSVRVDTSDVSDVQLTSSDYTAQEVFLTFRFTMPSEPRPPCPQCMPYKPKPAPIPEPKPVNVKPITKSPAYEKPTTKSPGYDAERAERIKKTGNIYRDK